MANELKARVELATGPAQSALAQLSTQFKNLSANSNTSQQRLKSVATQMNAVSRAAANEAQALTRLAAANKTLMAAEDARRKNNAVVAGIKIGNQAKADAAAGARALQDSRMLTEEVKRRGIIEDQNYKRQQRNAREAAAVLREQEKAVRARARAEEQAYEHLAATRYALYDVSRMLTVAGVGMVAFEAASVGVAIAWERDFANVVRTVANADTDIGKLKEDFVDLAQTIPESWENLTKIGTLAGQLGIADDLVVDFTRTVAKFSATTDVSVEDAATAFGRLNSLLPDVNGNFEGIADSVALVGVKSVATESQIIKIATQISALGSQAGFSYDEIIGLSGALASVAVPPELSRGVVTRVFGTISRAIADGGTNLVRFGKLAGMSAQEFKTEWSEDAGGTFLKFMKGIKEQGGNAEAAIRALGITSVRDVPILIRLANAASSTGQAGELLAESFRNAANATGEMDRQYAIIENTISAKLTKLANSFQSVLDAIGGAQLGGFGSMLDILNDRLRQLENFASSDVGGWILGIGAALTVLAGALALLGGLAARGVAGYAALITALQGLQAAGGGAAVSMGSMNAMLAATGPLGRKAAAGIRILSVAMKALTAATIVLAVPDVSAWLADVTNDITNAKTDLDSRMKETFTEQNWFDQWMNSFTTNDFGSTLGKMFADAGLPATTFNRKLKEIDDQIADMANNGNLKGAEQGLEDVRQKWIDSGRSAEQFKIIFGDAIAATAEAKKGEGNVDGLAGSVEGLTEEEQEAAQAAQDLLDVFASGDSGFVSIAGAMDSVIQKQKDVAQAAADSTDDASDSWEDFYDGQSFSLTNYLDELQKQVDAQSAWEQNMSALAGRVSENTLAELGRLGPEGAPLVAKLVNATDEELAKFDTLFSEAGKDAGVEFAVALVSTQTLVNDVGAKLGSGAKKELLTRLRAGEDFNSLLAEYTAKMNGLRMNVPPPSLAKPQAAMDNFVARNMYRNIVFTVDINVRNNALAGLVDQSGRPINDGQFAAGGYTGDGGKYEPKGVVHGGEFVFTKTATAALGTNFLYGLMNGATNGYADGGRVRNTSSMGSVASAERSFRGVRQSGTQEVALSAADRHLLRKFSDITLMVGGRTVQDLNNKAIITNSNRGTN